MPGAREAARESTCVVTQADGSLVKTEGMPDADLLPSLLTLTDVMATGWHAAVGRRRGSRRDGSSWSATARSGCAAVIAAVRLGSEKVVAKSRHEPRQRLARAFGATHLVTERGKDATAGGERRSPTAVGADAVLECVGTGQAMTTAIEAGTSGVDCGIRRRGGTGWNCRCGGFSRETSGWPGVWPRCAGTFPSSSTWCSTGTIDPGRGHST